MLSCFFGLRAHVTDYAFSFSLLSHRWQPGCDLHKGILCTVYIYIYIYIYIYRCRFKSVVFDVMDALALVFSPASTLRHNIFVFATKEPSANVVGERVALVLRMQDMLGLNLGSEIGFPY